MQRQLLRLLCGAALVVGCAGCGSLTGRWTLLSAEPNRDVFALDDAVFQRDGGFSALVTLEGKTRRETGRYRFTGFNLTLWPEVGGKRSYNAQLRWGTLTLAQGERRVVLQKEGN